MKNTDTFLRAACDMTNPVSVPLESIETEEDNEPPSILKESMAVSCPSFQMFFPTSRYKTVPECFYRQGRILSGNKPYETQEFFSGGSKVLTLFFAESGHDSAAILSIQ